MHCIYKSRSLMCRIVAALTFPVLLILAACDGNGGSSPSPDDPPEPPGGNDPHIALERVFGTLAFDEPVLMLQPPGDSSHWFVVERGGRVRVFANNASTNTFDPDFIDIGVRMDTAGEGGLLGMAFHPDFANNGYVYLYWTGTGAPLVSIISRFTTIAGGTALDPSSEQETLRLNQPFTNHNGGHIAFGPDGYLYIGFGDGGGSGDPNQRAQDTTNLLGAMLRIDVDNGVPYSIPADNPFAGNPVCTPDPNVSVDACPEIYAWGLRNPWRWSFDALTGTLWAADVGQENWEEINQIVRGGNYGWNIREGAHCFNPSTGCSTVGLTEPVAEYGRNLGTTVTGGYTYRGTLLTGLAGAYLFGDFGSGHIWRLVDSGNRFMLDQLLDTNLSIVSFGQDNNNELYVVDIGGGLYRVVND